jgi:signal transduction histidine kinase
MTDVVAGVVAGILAALLGVMILLHRRRKIAASYLERALDATALWYWRTSADSRIAWIRPGRRCPAWLTPESMVGLTPWSLADGPRTDPPTGLKEAVEARIPFYDVPVHAKRPGQGQITYYLSAVPIVRHGTFLGYCGAAVAAPGGQSIDATGTASDYVADPSDPAGADDSRRYQALAREMESFAYSVSHDLRAPLRIVDGFANIVLEDYGARLDEIGREHIGRIVLAAGRMNAMIDALLTLARRTGRELAVEPCDLTRTARDVAEELRATEFSRKVDFSIEPDLRALGDPELLRLVLQNLLGNAFKFTARAPQARVEFGCRHTDGADVFFVRDNGAGFDMRFADRLFGMFQRLHPADEYPGTGVGLATVQRIVRRHGGRIWAESAPGQGACFYFTLAANKPKSSE